MFRENIYHLKRLQYYWGCVRLVYVLERYPLHPLLWGLASCARMSTEETLQQYNFAIVQQCRVVEILQIVQMCKFAIVKLCNCATVKTVEM